MSDLLNRLRERDVPDWLRALYSVIYLATFVHAIIARGAWTCCPPAYGDDLATFAHAAQVALAWTGATVAAMEVLIIMVLLVPKVYYGIKEKGMREGEIKGRAEGEIEGERKGIIKGERAERERIAAALDAAVITDPETRRIVMNGHGGDNPRANRNGQ